MANLEAKTYMSSIQLGVVIITTCMGDQIMFDPRALIASAEHAAWLSVIIGGVIFYVAICLMLKLGTQYPGETLVEYAPRLFGRLGGSVVIFWFNLLLFLQSIQIFSGIGKVITFYMFDRTPPEVVILALLVVSTYCALQDWGTILRVLQIMFFLAHSMFTVVWMTSILMLQPENLLPLWPINTKVMIREAFSTWSMFNGYEVVLILLPLVSRKATFAKLAKVSGWVFAYMISFLLLIIIIIIGVLTVENAKNVIYPVLTVIRSVELPGTFIERLENYLLLAWIPTIFDSLVVMMFIMGQVSMRHYHYADHRPWVLALVPIIYVGSVFLETYQVYDAVSKFTLWGGLGFTFGVVPLSLLLSWRKKRTVLTGCG